MGWKLCCLMTSGIPITVGTRNLLERTAQAMAREGRQRQRVKNEECEGIVTTNFDLGTLVTFVGMVFSAEIECDRGKAMIRYLVDTRVDYDQVVDEYWVESPPGRAERAAYN